ncbi:carbon-nitrogen hydrolase family protein [Micromonospora sp. LH3U1]|uniref:carbon-nitrogen hydrolase family protein n=1 Tax=Micromonospora sp. LH3U1 TaxID=3018339 RepID=UPI00300DECCB
MTSPATRSPPPTWSAKLASWAPGWPSYRSCSSARTTRRPSPPTRPARTSRPTRPGWSRIPGSTRCAPRREAGVTALVGAAARHPDGRRTIAALVIDRAGVARVGYDKQQLWGDERELFSAGGRGATLLVDDWRLGLGICYDGCFPEHGRAAALDGAHGYLCPSGYLTGSEHRRDLYYAARALDNTMFVVFSNAVGGVDPWRFNGGAAIYDPQGRVLTRGADDGTAVLVATLDPDVLAATRAAHSMLADRLPDQGGPRLSMSG